MNLIEKLCKALRRFHQVVSGQIDFHGGDAHAGILGVQGRKHKVEKTVSVCEMAAPRSEILEDQAERLVRTLDGKFEKALGLLLGRQVADGFQVGVHNAGIGRGHEAEGLGRCGRQQSFVMEPMGPGNFNARDLIAGDSRKGGQENHQGNVLGKTIRRCRIAMTGPFHARSGLEGPRDAYRRVVHGSRERSAFGAR